MTTHPDTLLKQRGIYEQAMRDGWEVERDFWKYPLYDRHENKIIGYRRKIFNPDTHQKYGWYWKKPDDPDAEWYITKGTRQAIADADGLVYIANGEPAVEAMKAAGIHNVLSSTLSEVAVPKNIIDLLQSLDVKHAIYLADNDNAGERAAENWRNAIFHTSIIFDPRIWVEYPAGSDSNDVWIAVDFSPPAFRKALDECTLLTLPAYQKEKKRKRSAVNYSDDLKLTIENTLSASYGMNTNYKTNGWSHNFSCVNPMHTDQKPSAGYHPETGALRCFTCGETYPPETIAGWLGIDLSKFKKQKTTVTNTKDQRREEFKRYAEVEQEALAQDDTPADPLAELAERYHAYENGTYYSWFDTPSIPLHVLSAIYTLSHSRSEVPYIAYSMHQLLMNGHLNAALFTSDDLACQLPHITANALRKALDSLVAWGFLSLLNPNTMYSIQGAKDAKNGRPPKQYSVNADYERHTYYYLLEALGYFYREQIFKDVLVSDMNPLLDALMDSGEGWKDHYWQWRKRHNGLDDPAISKAMFEYKSIMTGDFSWVGWRKALKSSHTLVLNDDVITNTKTLRQQLYRHYVLRYEDRPTVSDLSMLFGCSDNTVRNMQDGAMIVTKPMYEKVTEAVANDISDQISAIARRHRGIPQKASVKTADGKWRTLRRINGYQYSNASVPDNAIDLFVLVQAPSQHIACSYTAWIQARWYYLQTTMRYLETLMFAYYLWLVISGIEIEIPEAPTVIVHKPIKQADTEPTERTIADSAIDVEDSPYYWRVHSVDFAFAQLRIELFMFTGLYLRKDGIAINLETGVWYRFNHVADVLRYINNENLDNHMIHNTATYQTLLATLGGIQEAMKNSACHLLRLLPPVLATHIRLIDYATEHPELTMV